MFVTAIPLLIIAGFLVFGLLGQAYLLKKGAAWARLPAVRFRYALLTAVALLVASLALLSLERFIPVMSQQGIAPQLVSLVLHLVIAWIIVAVLFRTTFTRAILAWLPTLIIPAVLLPSYYFAVRPHVFETFFCPTSSMAPTIVGPHTRITCPVCGAPTFVPGILLGESRQMQPAICRNYHISEGMWDVPKHPSDRFICNKLLRPRRWDIIAYRVPSKPSERWVKRVIGMPGEEVIIRDGEVWIDGRKQTLPAPLNGLKFRLPLDSADAWGTPDKPAKLGAGEYFVVGDFSVLSVDSRLCQEGAPVHPPYAVPASHIEGVVTHIYWPVSRWRSLRPD